MTVYRQTRGAPALHLSRGIAAAWAKTPASPRFWLLLSAYNLILGLVLLAGGDERIRAASFQTVREYGGHTTWGVALIAIGAVIVIAPTIGRRFLGSALAVAAVLHLLLAAGFVAAAVASPDASLTGPPTYCFVAASMGLHASHYIRAARTP